MKIQRQVWALTLIGASVLVAPCELRAATSVSHYGITWIFSSNRPTGTFVNGEPWVVGPVTVSNIDPNPSQSEHGSMHGSMVNPIAGKKQGFDSNPKTIPETAYDAALNVALTLPIKLVAGDVLVSAKTVYTYPNYFDTVCVLTVLDKPAPEGSFRPGPYGTDRKIRWNKRDINYGVLKNLRAVPCAPTQVDIEAKLPALPWWEWSGNWTGGLLCPIKNLASPRHDGPSTYGREIAGKWGEVGLWLNLNNPQAKKEKAMIQTIQCGIDIWSYVSNGGAFYHDGGHKCGRKFPVFLAAVALNDPILLEFVRNPEIFQEDTQTFFVQQSDVGRVVQGETFDSSQVGMAEWGIRHRWDPNKDDSRFNCGVPYRHVVWPAMAGPVLAAHLMGREAAWGHPAIFAYNVRYKELAGLRGFVGEMWDAYFEKTASPPPGK